MKPLQIVRKRLVRHGDAWRVAPDDGPPATSVWAGTFVYIPGPLRETRARIDAVRTFGTAALYPAEGGAWVQAQMPDLERIVRAITAA
ncbi:hypothetical protein FHS55_002595 [Angulomicrobium tetraedrale]|uniref:Uncharacterized protein n=1 Tax=Ancylobacter tetraedralis TaxID=217068 RepID=A0A839ZBB0_9HYPH|nr:hypothetical protein [Ancylobacter tetraedralis]MBB3771986.1 hypothetical protein [Ancylobacter tetraedralis]